MQITTQQANQKADRPACSDPTLITMTTGTLCTAVTEELLGALSQEGPVPDVSPMDPSA
jgi:hypothetical protein